MSTLFDQYAPFDNGPGSNVTEDGWRAFMRRLSTSGVLRNTLLELLPFGDSTGMQVKVNTGEVWIEGHWGQASATKALPIVANATGAVRLDLVVARADFTNNNVVFDVITGTSATVVPLLTQNTSIWEIPISVVSVPNGAGTITATNVLDARQFGGPIAPTAPDDYSLYGDKISSCRRFDVTQDSLCAGSNLYFVRLQSFRDQVVSQIRLCPAVTAASGVTVRVFHGFRQDELTQFIDPTTATFLNGGTAGNVSTSALPQTLIRAGETVVVAVAVGVNQISLVGNVAVSAGAAGNISNFLNPTLASTMVVGFKTAGMPSTLNIIDSSWSKRDRLFWCALA